MRLQDVELAWHLRRREQIAGVRVLRDEAEGFLLAHAADHDRRTGPREALGTVERVLEDETLPREAALVVTPHPRAELERVLEPLEPFGERRERDAESASFLLVPRRADPEHGPAAGEHVERRDRLCEDSRVPVHDAGDHGDEARLLGVGGEIPERRVGLEHVVIGWAKRSDLEEMVHDPDRIEPASVRGPSNRRDVVRESLGTARPREVVDLEADPQERILRDGRETSRSLRLSALVLADLDAVREVFPDLLDLRTGVEEDVRLERIPLGVVLVVVLARIEAIERDDFRDDGAIEDLRGIELLDVGLGHALLLVVRVEDHRAILLSDIRALPVLRRRVVRDREEDLEELAVRHARGVETHLDRLGMRGPT